MYGRRAIRRYKRENSTKAIKSGRAASGDGRNGAPARLCFYILPSESINSCNSMKNRARWKPSATAWWMFLSVTANFPSLPFATFSETRKHKNLLLFAYHSSVGSRFWQSVFLFLLLIIRQMAFLPVFAKMIDTEVSTRCWTKPFPFSLIQETGNWQPDKQQIFFKTYCFRTAACGTII